MQWQLLSKRTRILLATSAGLLLIGGGLFAGWAYLANQNDHKNSSDAAEFHEENANVDINDGTEEITLSNGKKQRVVSGELLVRLKDNAAFDSFGDKIRPGRKSGEYILTVEGDLLKAAEETKKKPGVISAATIPVTLQQ